MNRLPDSPAPVTADAVEPPPASEGELSIDSRRAGSRMSNAKEKRRNVKKPKSRRAGTSTALRRGKRTVDSSPPETNDGWQGKVREHRRRQASVATILNRTFGRFAKSHPDLWERRAYLMLVGLMYQWLAANENEVSTDELVSLSKALAEQRRVEAHSRGSGEMEAEGARGEGELPEDFGEAVKQIYGTNFQAPT